MINRLKLLLLGLCLWGAVSGAQAGQRFVSGPERATVVELFTSQGCSSCPPAEAYLNGLRRHEQLWRGIFPMALHVDYWDYIGWKDRFASPAHGQRQRAYARLLGARTVYTPAFFVNGRPWRRGLFSRQPTLAEETVGRLEVSVADSGVRAVFAPEGDAAGPLVLNVALLGMGLESSIAAGERQGSHSRHEFVVLGMAQVPPVSGAVHHWAGELPVIQRQGAAQLALVAWLSRRGNITPVQAAGGLLTE